MKMFALFVLTLLFIISCTATGVEENTIHRSTIPTNVDQIEIIHFHGTHQCYSCILVGKYAEDTVNIYFGDELESGKIVFAHINGELGENSAKVMQYGATGASLWLGVYDNNGFHSEHNTNVWYKINNKDEYMTYLKAIIEKRLEGDYT